MADVKNIASVSFGKDSLAMLLLIIEKELPLDEVVFYDTGMEFLAIYNIRDQIKTILNDEHIKYVELRPPRPFTYDMLERRIEKRDGTIAYGSGWCGGACRWHTYTKIRTINKHTGDSHVYVGIAADEEKRLANLDINKSSPIAEAGMTEADCLSYCRDRGFNWFEQTSSGCIDLYDILDRVSCWCCKNKNLRELRNIYKYLPNYWEGLRKLQAQINIPMKGDGKSVFDLQRRFEIEEQWIADGQKLNTRAFYRAISEG